MLPLVTASNEQSESIGRLMFTPSLTIGSHLQTELLANMGGLGVSCEQPVEGVNDTFLKLGTRDL